MKHIIVADTPDDLFRRAAGLFCELAGEGIQRAGRFTVALSGGSTPAGLYRLLAGEPYRGRLGWDHVHFFWGDERCVPLDDPQSNFRMARETLLDALNIPPSNVHRIPTEAGEPFQVARRYETEIRSYFQLDEESIPRFDLILLGMGEDGHTASLFPGSPALREKHRLVAANFIEKLQSHRITLTFPVINSADNVVFLVSGAGKAPVVHEVLEGSARLDELPAQRIHPRDGSLYFLLDHAAASEWKDRVSKVGSGE